MAGRLKGKRVLFVVAPEQFRDEEYLEPRRVLEREGAQVEVASTKPGTATGMLGAKVEPGFLVKNARASDFDAVVAVGGMGSPEHLWNHTPLRAILQDRAKAGKVVAGICLSGAVLGKAGVAKGRRATCWPDAAAIEELRKGGARYEKQPVVADGNVITADGPASARAFGEAIAAALGGGPGRDEEE